MIEIIRASAGSGKTYTLAVRYVEMLMWAEREYMLSGQGWVRNVHRRTLAITFTNNSTNEMKERIVRALYDIRRGVQEDYIGRIMESFAGCVGGETEHALSVQRERIMEVAGRLLEEMLEDWQMVRVSTIDSFFYQVVNAFVHELGIDETPAVDLDCDAIVERAVDNMLGRLEEVSPEGRALVRFLGGMVDEALAEGRRWNIRAELVKIARESLKWTCNESKEKNETPPPAPSPGRGIPLGESCVTQGVALGYGQFALSGRRGCESEVRTVQVFEMKRSMQGRVREIEGEVEGIWGEMRVRIGGMDGVLANCFNAVMKGDLGSKSLRKAVGSPELWFKKGKGSRAEGEWLSSRCAEIVSLSEGVEYRTLRALLEGMNYTGVIAELGREVDEVCRENDSIMISTVNELINEIVRNSSTPFIYEKTGLGTDHYMIDEFQDTSVTQWENFVPLIEESNAQGKESLVVGDVKQSIYRWREGNWRILQEGVKRVFGGECREESLSCNYRSCEGIVEFNNRLYEGIVERFGGVFGESLGVVYGDVRQGFKKRDGAGSVCTKVVLMSEKKVEEFYGKAMGRIVAWVRERGKGSAVLVRKNKEAQIVAEALARAGVRFVSAESLLVGNDVAVRFVTAIMRYVIMGEDKLVGARLRSLYRCVTGGDEVEEEMVDRLREMPLEEMCMAVVRRYRLDEIDGGAHRIFVYTLADLIRGWVRSNDGCVNRWLEYWGEKCESVCVPLPDDEEAVVIMTVHKAKGLQFRNVALLMGSSAWECGISGRHEKMVRVELGARAHRDGGETEHAPSVQSAYVNINSKRVEGSVYDEERRREWEECCIDELNALYVATTRAEERMLIVGNRGTAAEERYKNFCMVNVLEEAMRGWGDEMMEEYVEGEDSDEMFEANEMSRERGEMVERGEMPMRMNVRVPKSEEQERGIEMHEWLAGIGYEDEVCDGGDVWEKVRGTGWFSREWDEVWNEREVAYRGRTIRPDRVMVKGCEAVVVDWKTGVHEEKYVRQVREYCEAISLMGYSVRGYLYYIESGEVVEV